MKNKVNRSDGNDNLWIILQTKLQPGEKFMDMSINCMKLEKWSLMKFDFVDDDDNDDEHLYVPYSCIKEYTILP
jgi:hypothetical protein